MTISETEPLTNESGPRAPRKTCILVLGMHRSGTSFAAGLLAQFGMQRPLREMAPHAQNAKGYFEPIDIVEIHDALLKALGSHWSDVRRLPEGWEEAEDAQTYVAGLQQAYNSNYVIPGTAILKDPRICRLLPLWVRLLSRIDVQPYALFVTRHPAEVARSLAARDALDLRHGLLLWLRHTLDAEYNSRSLRRYFVPFDRKRSLEGVARALDFFKLERLHRSIDGHREEELYDQGLRHHHHDDAVASLTSAFPWIDRIVDAMSKFEASPGCEEAKSICDDVRREVDQACTAFGWVLFPLDTASISLSTHPSVETIIEDAAFSSSLEIAAAEAVPLDKPTGQTFSVEDFDEDFYLQVHPDVASSVAAGNNKSGFDHWTQFGLHEGRLARSRDKDAVQENVISQRDEITFVQLKSTMGDTVGVSGVDGQPSFLEITNKLDCFFTIEGACGYLFAVTEDLSRLTALGIERLEVSDGFDIYNVRDLLNGAYYTDRMDGDNLARSDSVETRGRFVLLLEAEARTCGELDLASRLARASAQIGGRAADAAQWLRQTAGDRRQAMLLPAILTMMGGDDFDEFGRLLTGDRHLLDLYRDGQGDDVWASVALPALNRYSRGESDDVFDMDLDRRGMNRLETAGFDGKYVSISQRLNASARASYVPTAKICVVATCRNEGRYLIDWLAYHRSIGVDFFFLYSNDNDDKSDQLLATLDQADIIKWRRHSGETGIRPQYKAYGYALQIEPAILQYEWAMVMDLDEYFTFDIRQFRHIGEYVDWQASHDADAIALCWSNYGPFETGEDAEPVFRRFIYRKLQADRHVKSIFKPRLFVHSHPHYPIWDDFSTPVFLASDGSPHLTEKINSGSAYSPKPERGLAWSSHFLTKSAEEYLLRRSYPKADNHLRIANPSTFYFDQYIQFFKEYSNESLYELDRTVGEIASQCGFEEEKKRLLDLHGVREALAGITEADNARTGNVKIAIRERWGSCVEGGNEDWFLQMLS